MLKKIIFIISLIGIAGTALLFSFGKNENKNQMQSDYVNVQGASPNIQGDWKVYDHQAFGYRFSYPANLQPRESPEGKEKSFLVTFYDGSRLALDVLVLERNDPAVVSWQQEKVREISQNGVQWTIARLSSPDDPSEISLMAYTFKGNSVYRVMWYDDDEAILLKLVEGFESY